MPWKTIILVLLLIGAGIAFVIGMTMFENAYTGV